MNFGKSEQVPKHKPPFPFISKIYKVAVDVSGELIRDHEAELRKHLGDNSSKKQPEPLQTQTAARRMGKSISA